jgi:hypothetical protein
MKFPSKSSGEKNEKIKHVIANVLVRRLVVNLLAANLMLIAFGADAFFWVAGKMGCSCGLSSANAPM